MVKRWLICSFSYVEVASILIVGSMKTGSSWSYTNKCNKHLSMFVQFPTTKLYACVYGECGFGSKSKSDEFQYPINVITVINHDHKALTIKLVVGARALWLATNINVISIKFAVNSKIYQMIHAHVYCIHDTRICK